MYSSESSSSQSARPTRERQAAAFAWGIYLLAALVGFTSAAVADQSLFVSLTVEAPEIDGRDDDAVWHQADAIVTRDEVGAIDVTIKAVHTNQQVYFLIQFPDPDESRLHKPWIWNPAKGMYDMGPEREDCFILKWATDKRTTDLSVHADDTYAADIWFWKANRTDPVGYADDKWQKLLAVQEAKTMSVVSKTGKTMYLMRKGDAGKPAYYSVIQLEKMADTVPQFSYQEPEDNRADVRAKGIWNDGQWTIEFARALHTDHADDVQFDTAETYLFGISRYEIGGKKPDPKLTQPLYGSGDVSEGLTLVFMRESI